MSGPVIQAEGLSRWYGEVIGLNEVTVDVEPGITGLLGPNGAGKSTFLRVVSGELRPSLGLITVLGEHPFGNAVLHRRIGYCPEGDRFFSEYSCRDYLRHLLRLSGYPKRAAAARADRALRMVGMSGSAGTRLGACSKGMRQRTKLAQALAHDPEFLLLDEPLTGLDPIGRHEIQRLIRRLAEGGVSVLISSHVLHEIEALTNRVLMIHKGRIAASGEVAEIRSVMDRHPHRIRVETPHARRLAKCVVDRDDLRSLRFDKEGLLLETTAPEEFYAVLPALVIEEEIEITGLTSPDDRLEAVFDILVSGGATP